MHFLTPKRMTLSSANASLRRREKEKREFAEDDGKGKREERFPPFLSSHRPPRLFYFLITRIYSINWPGRLLSFWTLRVGAYSRLGAY